MTPLVSTLIPVSPTADPIWLKQAIDSTLGQEGCEHEVLVYLDGGTQTVAPDPRVRVIASDTNMGVAHALNAIFAHSTGSIIARLDADDFSFSGRYKKQLALMERQNLDVVGAGLVFGDNCQYPPPCHDTASAFECVCSMRCPIHHPTMMARKSSLLRLSPAPYPTEFPHAEDFALHVNALQTGLRYGNVVEVVGLVYYRRHENQVSRLHAHEQRISVSNVMRSLCHTGLYVPDGIFGPYRLNDQSVKEAS